MAASDSQGALSRLYIEPAAAPHTFDSNSETYEVLYETMRKQGRIVGGNGIRGTRSKPKERTRAGAYSVGGKLAFNPDPGMLDLWLPRILGAAESTDVFAVAETLPSFGVLINRVTAVGSGHFEYKNCQVNRAMFHGKAGPGDGDPDIVEMVLDIMATDEATGTSVSGVSALAISTASNAALYMHHDAAFSFVSATRQPKEWWVLIDNHLQPRFVNSITATRISSRDRTVVVRSVVPFDDDHDDLYAQSVAGASGTITLTNGNMSTLFTFANLQSPDNSPTIRGKTETNLTLDMVARTSSTTKELVVTHDSTA